jgi:plastocyanin
VALGVVALVSVGCGDDGEPAGKASAGGAGPTPSLVEGVVEPVGVIDNTFRPGSVEVATGTEVEWTNDGRNDHNVLPVDGDDWGVEAADFAPDAVYRHRFTEPGTYHYYCSLHGTTTKGMVGTIVVTG